MERGSPLFPYLLRRSALYLALTLTASLGGVPVTAATADDAVRCVQAFLDFEGYDPGPIDGALGGRTVAAAAEFAATDGQALPALSAASAAAWCANARDDAAFARLLGFDYAPELLPHQGVTSNRDPDQVLVGDSRGHFIRAERNVGDTAALGFVGLDDGLVAARIRVRYADEGHPDDWFWNDEPGVQQRFELAEERDFSMRNGETYWHRLSVFVPGDLVVAPLDQLVLTDMKPKTDAALYDPVFALKLGEKYLQVDHLLGRPYQCMNGYSEGGHENTYCDLSKEQAFIAPTETVRDRWLNFVYRMHWADDASGQFHLWLDDELIMGVGGPTAHGGAIVLNKFGVYRGFQGSQGTPQPDARLWFAGVGRADSCAALGLSSCEALEADVERIDTPGIIGRNLVEEDAMSDYLAAGGQPYR